MAARTDVSDHTFGLLELLNGLPNGMQAMLVLQTVSWSAAAIDQAGGMHGASLFASHDTKLLRDLRVALINVKCPNADQFTAACQHAHPQSVSMICKPACNPSDPARHRTSVYKICTCGWLGDEVWVRTTFFFGKVIGAGIPSSR